MGFSFQDPRATWADGHLGQQVHRLLDCPTTPPEHVLRQVIVLDNGGCAIKMGLHTNADNAKVFPNCMAKVKGERQVQVGHMLLSCRDLSNLSVRRPIERGYLVNVDAQRDIWAHSFSQVLRAAPENHSLLLTEPVFNLPSIQDATDQVVFEDLGFPEYFACPAGLLSLYGHAGCQPSIPANQAQCGLVVDAGFSFTHALPIFDGQLLHQGVRRINLGGKALTNYFKELVSYRSVNMMDESFLIEIIKDAVCFVSKDAKEDLRLAHSRQSPYRLDYVLPDGLQHTRGYARDPSKVTDGASANEQVLKLNNERFMVPEALFQPTDIGMQQAGLAETIVQSVEAVPESLHGLLYSNVILTGGMAACPGFRERLHSDLRKLVPSEYDLGVQLPADPVRSAFKGGARLASSGMLDGLLWTKQEYEEQGSARLHGRESEPL